MFLERFCCWREQKPGFLRNFDRNFFHADSEAVDVSIRISFSQEPFKRMWVGVNGSFDVFGYLRGPHEEFEKVVLMFWGHVNFTTRIRKWKHSPYPVLDNPNPYPKVCLSLPFVLSSQRMWWTEWMIGVWISMVPLDWLNGFWTGMISNGSQICSIQGHLSTYLIQSFYL